MRIITLTGASSNGKDTILNKLVSMNIGLTSIISTTSRPMRVNEQQGREYHFVSKEKAEVMLKNNKFIESREYHVANGETWIYGVSKDSIDLNSNITYIVIIDFQGLIQLEDFLCNRGYVDNLTSIYIDCSFQNRLLRSLQREGKMSNEQVDEVIRRFTDDNKKVLPALSYCDYVVNNDGDFDVTMNRILDIVESEI